MQLLLVCLVNTHWLLLIIEPMELINTEGAPHMPLKLFEAQTPPEKQHPIYKMLMQDRFAPEREVLQHWAEGFEDRDGKFVKEFQSTFESSLWELYLHAALKELGLPIDMRHHAPDFTVEGAFPFGLEATIAAPAAGGKPALSFSQEDIPEDFTKFNIESTLRICNSFDAKVKRYRKHYSQLSHLNDRPFVIGIASFDRPLAHFASGRAIIAAVFGLYHDEAATKITDTDVCSYNVTTAPKSDTINIELGLFCDDTYAEVSAVIYSCLAIWGKMRALADNPDALTLYTTFHPNPDQITPRMCHALKRDYTEHLMDGLFVLHNPYARHPIPKGILTHPRICEINVAADGELIMDAPDDFLLMRMLQSALPRTGA